MRLGNTVITPRDSSSLKIPGKTFLVGEYAVLVGGEALGLATIPFFEIDSQADIPKDYEYHPHSAVGLFFEQHTRQRHIKFQKPIYNPYQVGGFGQSTAEFIAAYYESGMPLDLKTMYQTYKELYSGVDLAVQPSGADLVIQMTGGVTYVTQPIEKSQSYVWPFSDLSFLIVSTGNKIKTHEHLQSLDRAQLKSLIPYSDRVIKSFFKKDPQEFLTSLRTWCETLQANKLTCVQSIDLRQQIEVMDGVLLAKPCGALGADVLLVFCESSQASKTEKKIQNLGRTVLASEQSLAVL